MSIIYSMTRFIPTLFLTCSLFIPSLALGQGSANPDVRAGWEYFAENDLDAATQAFQQTLAGPDAAYGHLGLSLVYAAMSNDQSFYHHTKFYELSSDPLIYTKAMWSIYGGEKSEEKLEYLEGLLTSEDGTIRTKAAQAIGGHYMVMNDRRKALEYYGMAGAIDTWRLLGEFENISESGFDRDFGAVAHPEAVYSFTNKRGVDITWFDLKQPRFDNWVDFDYHFYTNDAVYYAQTFCESPQEQVVQFRLGVSGSVKCWVNDELLFAEAQERDNGIDSYIFTGKLAKGNNRILLQIGTSETEEANFMLRLTDDRGMPVNNLSYTGSASPYPNDYHFQSEIIKDEVEAYYRTKIEQEPEYLEHYLTLTQYLLSADQVFKARKVLKEAKARFPDCSYVLFQLISASSKAENSTEASLYLEELKTKDPEGALSLDILYDEALEIDDYEEMERILAIFEKRQGLSEYVLEKKIELAGAQDQTEKLLTLIEKGFDEFPDNPTFLLLQYMIETQVNKNAPAGRKILKKYLKKRYNSAIVRTLIDSYFKAGVVSEGIGWYEILLENNPLATGFYSQFASILFQVGQNQRAEQYLEECTRIAPYVGTYYASLANNYRDTDQTRKALESYRKAISLDPYDYESREQVRIMLGLSNIFDKFEEPDIESLYLAAPEADAYPEEHSTILLDETQKVVYPGGGSEERRYLAVKVFNSRGVDYWKEYTIQLPGNQKGFLLEAEVLKKNGSKVSAQNQGGQLIFPNLEPGDAISLSYQIRDFYYGELIGHFWKKHYFQYFLPIEKSRFSLLISEEKEFEYQIENGNVLESVEVVQVQADKLNPLDGKMKKYVWTKEKVPAMENESFMSSLTDVGTVMYLSSLPDWDYVVDWYANLARAKAKPNFEVEQLMAELFPAEREYQREESIKIIYDYIVNNIRYSSVPFLQSGLVPQKASRVVAAKLGDCKDVSTLFVAMCQARGIEANLVLINTRNNGQRDMVLPSIDFNHCIAEVQMNGEPYFVELTAENLPFSSGYTSIKKAFALPIAFDRPGKIEATIIDPPTRVKNEVIRNTLVRFEGNKMIVNNSSQKSGLAAASMRDTYEGIGEEAQLKNMQEAVNSDFPNVKVLEVEFGDGLETNAPFVDYTYSYEVPDIFMSISDLQIFKLPWADNLITPDFLATDSREYAIEIWAYFSFESYEQTLNIQIPEGKTVSDMPENVFLETPHILYEMTFEMVDDGIKATRKFVVKEDVIPAESFEEFKEIMNKIVKADEMRLAIK